MIFVLIGKSLSGKTYLQSQLKDLKLVEPLKTSTTRPKRTPNEIGYHFVTDAQYNRDAYEHNALAVRKYKVANGDTWYYYLNQNELKMYNTSSLILDYKGYQEFKEEVAKDIKVVGIYLDIPIKERIMRHYGSERKTEDDKEFVRRLYDDEFNAFNGINKDETVLSVHSTNEAIDYVKSVLKKK